MDFGGSKDGPPGGGGETWDKPGHLVPHMYIPWPLEVMDLREPEPRASHLGKFRQGQREGSSALMGQIWV